VTSEWWLEAIKLSHKCRLGGRSFSSDIQGEENLGFSP
jgi:hypothetical protein